jgi:hypothetical protein
MSSRQLLLFNFRYGPFWVATTLVFVIAATGNYANYVSYKKKHSGTSSTVQVWYSNVDQVDYVVCMAGSWFVACMYACKLLGQIRLVL